MSITYIDEHMKAIHEAREVVRRTQAILDEATSARKAAAAAHEEATRRLLDAIDSAETAAAEEYPLWERERQDQPPPPTSASGTPSNDLVGQCAPVALLPPQAALPVPVKGLSAVEIADELADVINDNDLVDTLADLFVRITDHLLCKHYLAVLAYADHPEEWPDKLRAVLTRQHLVEDDDWTSEYARAYLDEVSQRANDLFREIAEWRRLQDDYSDPVVRWKQWFEFCNVSVRCPEGIEAVYETRVDVLYRYGDLTSRADGVETVECDFHLQTPLGNRDTITRVIGPASRSVGGGSIRDQLRVIATAVYEDAVREAREAREQAKPAKRTGGKRKGATT